MRTETLAIVFTDIKGYTAATSAQTHQENARMLRRIERLIAPVVRAYSGRVIKSIGDAYMLVFRSPTEAVRCATAIQDRLHQHNTSASADQSIHIRIAMNIGEVRVHRGDVFGEPVNIAARIEGVTPADEIYLSHAIYLTMNKTDLPAEKVGDFELKGIPEPVTLYRMKKFSHDEPAEGEAPSQKMTGLPFGGTQLSHWKSMRWVRRAYVLLWIIAMSGLLGAAYLQYRPTADYTETLAAIKTALDQGNALGALAMAGQIPGEATQERTLARRYRRQAVVLLLQSGDSETAWAEVTSLLHDDPRDPEALLLKGLVLAKRGQDRKSALAAITQALKLNPTLANRSDVMGVVVQGYADSAARRSADAIVEAYLKQAAIGPLVSALQDSAFDRSAKGVMAARLEKLGAAQEVDWVSLSLEDLKSSSCKTKKTAVQRLQEQGDERAVGPLMKLAESKACGATEAKKAADTLLAQ
jgi:class 3 adenylate cyclase